MIKILIVEDEALMRERLITTIDWHSLNCELVDSAENGKIAVEIINNQIPDIVLTDIKMPYIDGLDLSLYIKNNFNFIKVIIMTGYNDFEFAQKALQSGVKDYILKPFNSKKLIATIDTIKNEIQTERKLFDFNNFINIDPSLNFDTKNLSLINNIKNNYPSDKIQELLALFNTNQKDMLNNKISLFFKELTNTYKNISIDFLRSICIDIVIKSFDILYNVGFDMNKNSKNLTGIYLEIWRCQNIPEFIQWTKDYLFKLEKTITTKIQPIKKNYVQVAIDYINNNYMKNINLTNTANHIHLHPVYLGRLIKDDTGKSFNEILVATRIENSKKFLKDFSKKNYEIANAVGIGDPHYFSHVFKKNTGITPKEYRESLKNHF